AVGVDRSDRGLIKNVAAHTRNGVGCPVAGMRIARRQCFAMGAVITRENSNCPRTGLARQAQAKFWMSDIASKDQVDRAGEVVAVLQKERPLLGEEHRKSLVNGDLRLVRFDLAEVRIDRCIKYEAVTQDELRIQSHFRLQRTVCEDRMRGVAVINVMEPAQ